MRHYNFVTNAQSQSGTADIRRAAGVCPIKVVRRRGFSCSLEIPGPISYVQACYVENGGSSFGGIAGLLAVIVALEPGCLADGGIVLGTPFANRRGRAREVGAETTRLDDRHFDPERPDLFREHFGEAFDAPTLRLHRGPGPPVRFGLQPRRTEGYDRPLAPA